MMDPAKPVAGKSPTHRPTSYALRCRREKAREYDVCCNCSFDDQKARLDNLAIELQNDPSANAYIFGYGGRTSRTGEADRLMTRARDYLVNQRGIDASRVVVVNGGFREENCVEMWIVPRGAAVPQPRPTLQPGDVRPAPEAPARDGARVNSGFKSQVSSLKSRVRDLRLFLGGCDSALTGVGDVRR